MTRNGGEELPKSKVRGGGWEELPHAGDQGRRPAGRTNPTSKERWLQGLRKA